LKAAPFRVEVFYDGPEHREDRVNAIAVDLEGNTVITGRSAEICATVKYDPQGRQIWAVRYGTPGGRCYGNALGLDPKGDAFVVGQILRDDTDQFIVLKYAGPTASRFHRGDSNGDGRLDVSDGLCVLRSLFSQGTALECLDAADSNDDGRVDCSDALFTLGYLFLGTAPPPTPGPAESPCGPDRPEPIPSGDLGCETYERCVSTL